MSQILEILKLEPSPQSVDYVTNKKQFHLFDLLTEQRHPKTWNLSFAIQHDFESGLRMLLSVDEDISRRVADLVRQPALLEQATDAVANAVRAGRRVYFYGCGATGRLAKQMESSFWRPFWSKVKRSPCWEKLKTVLPGNVEELLVGEMTPGYDLVSIRYKVKVRKHDALGNARGPATIDQHGHLVWLNWLWMPIRLGRLLQQFLKVYQGRAA